MDKSAVYVTLCDRAAEIQRLWMPRYGDFYRDGNGRITCWLSNGEDPDKRVKNRFIVRAGDGLIRLSKYVWLPRQDQLIEMAQVRGRRYDSVVQDFFDWTKQDYGGRSGLPGKRFPSMEQIWLAYLMQRKFRKTWDGGDWKIR